MAKRLKKKPVPPEGSDKVRIELRFDPDVYEGIKKLADDAQISVNQLMQGLSRWASQSAKLGDPVVSEEGAVNRQWDDKIQPGAIWFGKTATYRSMTRDEIEDQQLRDPNWEPMNPSDLQTVDQKGIVFFRLDFTERRVVRED